MGRVELPFLVSDTDRHGNVRVYFRRHGKKLRIREAFGSPEFAARYQELLCATERGPLPPPAPGIGGKPLPNTLRWLAVRYFESAEFRSHDPTYQKKVRARLEAMLQEPIAPDRPELFSEFPLARLKLAHLKILRERKADKPGSADNRVKALKALFAWAVEADIAETNIARDLKKKTKFSLGHHTWTIEELEQYERRHAVGTKPRLALDLLSYTGVRRSDVVRLGRQFERDGRLEFRAQKTRKKRNADLSLRILPELRASIDACASQSMTYLLTEYGRPFTANGFGNYFKKCCVAAGLPENCSAHGVRKAAAARAAENGATASQLQALFGWLSLSEAERYTREARRRELADSGITMLSRRDGTGT